MAELRITPGGTAGVISANSQYNIPSQTGGRSFPPADVRSGHEPINRAVVYDSAIEQMSQLSGRSISAQAGTFGNNGLIGFVDEWSIRAGSATNITSTAELYIDYDAVGENRNPL